MQTCSDGHAIQRNHQDATGSSLDEQSHLGHLKPGFHTPDQLPVHTSTSETTWQFQPWQYPSTNDSILSNLGYANLSSSLSFEDRYPVQSQSEPVFEASKVSSQDKGPAQTYMTLYFPKNPGSLGEAAQKPLQKTEHKEGSLYVFSKVSHPGYVKIGRTSVKVSIRLNQWKRQCGQDLRLEYEISHASNASRLEKLIHLELLHYRYKETGCVGEACRNVHREWFQVSVEVAKVVMDKWHAWVQDTRPYDEQGMLKENVEMPFLSYPPSGYPTRVDLPSLKRKRVTSDSSQTLIPFTVTKQAKLNDDKARDPAVEMSLL